MTVSAEFSRKNRFFGLLRTPVTVTIWKWAKIASNGHRCPLHRWRLHRRPFTPTPATGIRYIDDHLQRHRPPASVTSATVTLSSVTPATATKRTAPCPPDREASGRWHQAKRV